MGQSSERLLGYRQGKHFSLKESGSAVLCFLLGLLFVPLVLAGCSSGETALAYPTARVTKTWTPLPTLTPLATYTPSVTPLPTMPPPPEAPTRAPPPTIPVMEHTELLIHWENSRRAAAAAAVAANVLPPNVFSPSDSGQIAIGGYDGGETECCRWPVSGRITSNVTPNHIALDIATSLGTPVLAADGGRVVAAGWDNTGYGFRVILDHGQGLQTLYAHLSEFPVERGDEVNQGQIIGRIGSTGRSTGPHLHFEVRFRGRRITPWDLLP